ncbi:dihydroorotase [Rhizobiales bacterium GAS188]|nr:dihydroorotase [Rhizobiales bacterium GAS188]
MRGTAAALSLSLLIGAMSVPASVAQTASQPVSEQEAHAIGVDAYLYFYSLVTMDLTRKQLTNVEPGKAALGGPMNMFINVPTFPPADFKAVVRPNFDTLYSSAFLDLTNEPVIVSVPDTGGRYYLLPMLDMWTDVFASPGWRTTGTQAGNFLVAPPGWRPDLRDRFIDEFKLPKDTRRIDAPTPYVWIIGRTKTDGPPDYDAVHKIQAGYKVTLLSEWGKTPKPLEVKIDPLVDMKTPPKTQVDTMPAGRFFAYAADLMKLHPPHITDEPIIAQMKRIGIEPGKSFDIDKLESAMRNGLMSAPADAQKLMEWKVATLARVVNSWSMNTDTMGVYGNYYLKRALITQFGLGANLPEDAIYPLNLGDEAGKPLDGANKYTLHFEKGAIPPVNAFWSVTLYDAEGFQVGNPLDRFAVSSWMPFKYNLDGSLDLYFQNESPGKDNEANWLPAPKGVFNLTMRLYGPKSEALTGKWNPPPVTRVQAKPLLIAQ